jgi:hypothetical protein
VHGLTTEHRGARATEKKSSGAPGPTEAPPALIACPKQAPGAKQQGVGEQACAGWGGNVGATNLWNKLSGLSRQSGCRASGGHANGAGTRVVDESAGCRRERESAGSHGGRRCSGAQQRRRWGWGGVSRATAGFSRQIDASGGILTVVRGSGGSQTTYSQFFSCH